jgi:hypothetical protein
MSPAEAREPRRSRWPPAHWWPAQRSGLVQRRRERRPDDRPAVLRRTWGTVPAKAVVQVAVGGTRLGAALQRAGRTDDCADPRSPPCCPSSGHSIPGLRHIGELRASRSGDRRRPWREERQRESPHTSGGGCCGGERHRPRTDTAPGTTQADLPAGARPGRRGRAEGTRTPDPHTARPSCSRSYPAAPALRFAQ